MTRGSHSLTFLGSCWPKKSQPDTGSNKNHIEFTANIKHFFSFVQLIQVFLRLQSAERLDWIFKCLASHLKDLLMLRWVSHKIQFLLPGEWKCIEMVSFIITFLSEIVICQHTLKISKKLLINHGEGKMMREQIKLPCLSRVYGFSCRVP